MIGLLLLGGCDAGAGSGAIASTVGGVAALLSVSVAAITTLRGSGGTAERPAPSDAPPQALADTVARLQLQVESLKEQVNRLERMVRTLGGQDHDALAGAASVTPAGGSARSGEQSAEVVSEVGGGERLPSAGSDAPRVQLRRTGERSQQRTVAWPHGERGNGDQRVVLTAAEAGIEEEAVARDGAPSPSAEAGEPGPFSGQLASPSHPAGDRAADDEASAQRAGTPADDRWSAEAEPESPAADQEQASDSAYEDDATRWLDSLRAGPHSEVAVALGRLYLKSPWFGRCFRDESTAALLQQELGQSVAERLQRLQGLRADGYPSQTREWVELDLVPTIDALGRFLSAAAAEQRLGSDDAAMAYDALYEAIFVQLHGACVRKGWFGIAAIRPYETDFDPRIHLAVGNRVEHGASNRILEIRRVGRVDVRSGAALFHAHVVVGR